MKIAICTDIHFTESASLIRAIGEKYSVRLENCIRSIEWFESLATKYRCDAEFYLGDFFDKPELNATELSALSEIRWNGVEKFFLTGNHEASTRSLEYNSVNALYNIDNAYIISKPLLKVTDYANFLFIPYYLDGDRLTLAEYWEQFGCSCNPALPRIVLSHNDIRGISFGRITSQTGFDIADIEQNCDLFLNGHLHNGVNFCVNGKNLGNLTGLNFSEDASKYAHCAFILDTDTNHLEAFENPFALNFYQLEIDSQADLKKFKNLKANPVISIKCPQSLQTPTKEALKELSPVAARITILPESSSNDIQNSEMLVQVLDHKSKFADFCLNTLENSDVLLFELSKICED